MHKTDVFYPWVPSRSAVGHSEELKYSIRSVYQWWPVKNIWIVSEYDKPSWITNVKWLKIGCPEKPEKEIQIKLSIEAAINSGISDPFLYINDDQYLLDNQCIAWIQHLVCHQPHPTLDIATPNQWAQMCINTLKQLRENGHPSHNWCTHMPWLVSHSSYWKALNFFQHRLWQLESGVMNLQTRCWPLFLTQLPGLRLQFTEHVSVEHFYPYTCFLNHNDSGVERVWPLIKKLFPDKSRYEL